MSGSPGRILECLVDGLSEVGPISKRLPLNPANVRRHLQRMAREGRVELRVDGPKHRWFLAGQHVVEQPHRKEDETPALVGDRVKLATELLEIERISAEMAVRRAEILRALEAS